MKTFFDLVQEVQKPGLCHRCGGCVTFCTAVNYSALDLDDDGKPRYGDMEKCIECGLCYAICPEIDELEEETKRRANWSDPIGQVIETTVARSSDPTVRTRATDGGVVTGLLLHLLERGRIDGAIVTRRNGSFERKPFLATTSEDIKAAAGFSFDTSHGMKRFSDNYMTHSSIEAFNPLMRKGLRRVAIVGTPCQIKSVRRMQVMGLVPSESISLCLGLFCAGNFIFGDTERQKIADLGGFAWETVRKINIKENLMVHLEDGQVMTIAMEKLDPLRRHACRFCPDYAAEYADLSFGGIGAKEGWTTVISRSPLGRAVLADAKGSGRLEELTHSEVPNFATDALQKVRSWSAKKKKAARYNRRDLGRNTVVLKD
jgi:coenzyme F420 hydrogenase subunit beta